MKAEIKPASQAFQPVTLELTFETAEELATFKIVAAHELSTPKALRQDGILDYDQGQILSKQLATIQRSLHGIGN